jgi:hypothetical protein
MHNGLITSVATVARATVLSAHAYEAGRAACDRWLQLPSWKRVEDTENPSRCSIVFDAAVDWALDVGHDGGWVYASEVRVANDNADDAIWRAFLDGWMYEADLRDYYPETWGYRRVGGGVVR